MDIEKDHKLILMCVLASMVNLGLIQLLLLWQVNVWPMLHYITIVIGTVIVLTVKHCNLVFLCILYECNSYLKGLNCQVDAFPGLRIHDFMDFGNFVQVS